MPALLRVGRAIDEVAAQLADIHEKCAAVAHHVIPEFARRKFLADENRAAADQVIHRQAIVHAVVRPRVHHAREGIGRQHEAEMIDVGGLGQARRARCEDEQRPVLDREIGTLRGRQGRAVEREDCFIEARVALLRALPGSAGVPPALCRAGGTPALPGRVGRGNFAVQPDARGGLAIGLR